MKRFLFVLALLAACREDSPVPDPVALTPEAVGFFCQMNILDHGGPKAQVHLDAFPGQPLFFSQISDAMAYLRMAEKDGQVLATYVTDMTGADWDRPGQSAWIAADKAVYVLGSDRLGGMEQPEFIPFADTEAAADFISAHGGRIYKLDEIPPPAPDQAASPGDADDFAARLKSATESQ